MGRKIKCNKCGYIGDQSEFPKGLDFVQKEYIKSCSKCDNKQSPGDASMRMFYSDNERPFIFVDSIEIKDPLLETLRRSEQAS